MKFDNVGAGKPRQNQFKEKDEFVGCSTCFCSVQVVKVHSGTLAWFRDTWYTLAGEAATELGSEVKLRSVRMDVELT